MLGTSIAVLGDALRDQYAYRLGLENMHACRLYLLSVCLVSVAASLPAQVALGQADAATDAIELHETEASITIARGGQVILVYNKQPPPLPAGLEAHYSRSGFMHPVASPSGSVVTASYPADHPHQDGIFSAWVKTTYQGQPVDFWNLAGGTGRVVHERVVSTTPQDAAVGFQVDLLHRAQLEEQTVDVLREQWTVKVVAASPEYNCFDLETTQQALTDHPLVIEEYHYGGLALRGNSDWLLEGKATKADTPPGNNSHFLTSGGFDRLQGNHERCMWVALSGDVKGKPVTIAVLSHRDNFRAPQAVRLHPSKPYFCFAPCVDGRFTIDRDHPLRGKYRYIVTDALPDPAWLDQQWEAWSPPH